MRQIKHATHLMGVKIRVKYNHGIGAPEVDANLTVTGIRIEATQKVLVPTPPALVVKR